MPECAPPGIFLPNALSKRPFRLLAPQFARSIPVEWEQAFFRLESAGTATMIPFGSALPGLPRRNGNNLPGPWRSRPVAAERSAYANKLFVPYHDIRFHPLLLALYCRLQASELPEEGGR